MIVLSRFPCVGPGCSVTLPLHTLSKYQAKRAKIRVSTSNINSTCPMEELSMDSLMLDHLTPETKNNTSDLKVWETLVISLKVSISKQRWHETLYIILPCGIVAIKEWLECSQVSTLQVRKSVITERSSHLILVWNDPAAFIPIKLHLFPDSYMFSIYKDTTFN